MKHLRLIKRLVLLLLHLLSGLLITVLYSLILRLSPQDKRYKKRVKSWLSRTVRIIGGQIIIKGQPLQQGCLFVSNHISWLDIPVLGGCQSMHFLSKSDVKRWPVIGWLATCAGTLFIERGKQSAASQAASAVSQRLHNGDHVAVFPEATTSDGLTLLPFHARLFGSAQTAEVSIQPVAIRYLTVQGKPHPQVPFVGQQSLLTNVCNILTDPVIIIEVHFLEAIRQTKQYDRKQLAAASAHQIKQIIEVPLNTEIQQKYKG